MARRRLNKNMVIALTLVFFAVVIGLSGLMLHQLRRRDPANFVKLAEEYAASGEWEQAAMFYERAWRITTDPQYLVPFGDAMLKQGNVGQALQAWRQALVDSPDLLDAHQQLLDALLELADVYSAVETWRKVEEAADDMLGVLAEDQTTDEAYARHARGMALCHLVSQDATNEAAGLDELRRAAALTPEMVVYACDHASELVRADRVDDARKVYESLLDRFSEGGSDGSVARLAFGRHLGTSGVSALRDNDEARAAPLLDRAETLFREAVRLAKQDTDVDADVLADARMGLAEFLATQWARQRREDPEAAQPLFDEAERLLLAGVAADADAIPPFTRLAELYKRAGRYAEAVESADERLARGFSRRGLTASRLKLQAFQLMMVASEACVGAAVSLEAAEEIERRTEWLTRAQAFADQAAGEFRDHPRVLTRLGRIELARGNDRAALANVRRADEAYEARGIADWDTKFLLARLHLRFNEPGAAKLVLEEAMRSSRGRVSVSVQLLYAQALFAGGEMDNPALSGSLARVLAVDPDNADARRLNAAILERRGRTQQALESTDSPRVRALLRARELAIAGDDAGSLRELFAVLDEAPADVFVLRFAVGILLKLDRADEAGTLVDRAISLGTDDPQLPQLRLATRTGLSDDERRQALLDIIKAEPDSYRRALGLIDFYLRENELPAVLEQIETAERHLEEKDTPAAREAAVAQLRALLTTKMSAAHRLENEPALLAARDAAVRRDVDGAGGQSFVGLYHLYRDEIDSATKAFREAVAAQPTHARSLAHLAYCLQASGKAGEAKAIYERAVGINPNEPLAQKGLAMIAEVSGDEDAFNEHLEACRLLMPTDPWVAARLLVKQEQADPLKAIEHREELLQKNPEDEANLVRLAGLSDAAGDSERADRYHKQLLSIDPNNKVYVARAADYYRRTDRADAALGVVVAFVESRELGDARADARVLVAVHHLAAGNMSVAETTLLEAADEAQTLAVCRALADFYLRHAKRLDEALVWLDHAVEQARKTSSPSLRQLCAARIVTALQSSSSETTRARDYVDDYKSRFPGEARVLLWQSEIDAREGRIDRSISRLNEYLAAVPNDERALLRRALQYVALGRPEFAIQDLEVVKRAGTGTNLDARLLLARLYRQKGSKGKWIDELESLVASTPDEPKALEALVTAYIESGRMSDADRIVTARINRSEGTDRAHWLSMRGGLRRAEQDGVGELADVRRAAELSSYSSETVIGVLDVYERLSRLDEAIGYYRDHAPSDSKSFRLRSRYARLLVRSGDEEQAVGVFSQAVALAELESTNAVRQVALDVKAVWALERATGLFEKPSEDGSMSPANDRLLAQLYRLLGEFDAALDKLEVLSKSAATDRRRAELFFEQAELHELSKQWAKARQAYEQGLQYNDQNWVALNNLAYLLADRLDSAALARPYAERAVRLSDNPQVLDTLGWINVGLGVFDRAIADLNRAVRLDSDYPIARHHLGEAYRRSRRFDEAANVLKAGRLLAEAAGDDELVVGFDASLAKVEKQDDTP